MDSALEISNPEVSWFDAPGVQDVILSGINYCCHSDIIKAVDITRISIYLSLTNSFDNLFRLSMMLKVVFLLLTEISYMAFKKYQHCQLFKHTSNNVIQNRLIDCRCKCFEATSEIRHISDIGQFTRSSALTDWAMVGLRWRNLQ